MLKLACWLLLAIVPIAVWGVLCAINKMNHRRVPRLIASAWILISWGWAWVIGSAIDTLYLMPVGTVSPLLLVAAVFLASGNSLLFIASRRDCRCAGCPGRRPDSPRAQIPDWEEDCHA